MGEIVCSKLKWFSDHERYGFVSLNQVREVWF